MRGPILLPAIVLVLWTMVMLAWMGRTRIPAIGGFQGLRGAKPGARGQDLEGILPPSINWKAHNYAHLLEQPTLFYAIVVMLALLGAGPFDVAVAWAYTGLRIAHSLWQVLVNRVHIRFLLFILSSWCLLALAIHALLLALA